ncbi:MAG: electron transfer flavoprotein subunit alpha/FixB family protein [Candidatus Aminicenantes bacterium]|nr:electron transfer flavoprotein subunit alpha/FixB family protein [Candidatus Aminicenantes bacterium]NIM85020.1 electron transfer flavoprotein subunit alpha/FixB family protein [Candidatus Aminicenantes bacterium]NIN24534.1 electron transfer flavoprotein subunit alpha/FixB family protein [Candidatus Aminicenantes bacterium]NIN48298.1 electron transfer flavoprotein subunit alpha/FixB family protein [Candidatus Aminicenantes bacterium]NIN91201.1 electron transfer flavoprotein subunit alpha/Fix
MANIGVYIELRGDEFKKSNREALGVAKRSGKDVYAVLFSNNPEQYADELKGVAKAIRVNGGDLTYDPVMYSDTLAKIIKEYNLSDFVGVCSAQGKDLFPRVAAKVENSTLLNDCLDIDLANNRFTKPVYAGKLLSDFIIEDDYRLFTIRPNVFAPEEGPETQPEIADVEPVKNETKSKIVEIIRSASKKIDLQEAEIIVSGGRGMKSKENFVIIEELASLLNAGVGASRAAVDSEYATHDMQVGQTGKVVNPKLYIACGISGAIQHFVGMKTSKVIVAINKDPEAPIFKKADYGIVGDLFKIVPMLTEELKKAQ